MELTDLPLPPEIWAATPAAAQALIVAQQERIRITVAGLDTRTDPGQVERAAIQ